jgi:phosphomannomutase
MPEISRFFGIIIAMFYDEHNPPHFHARYGDAHAAIEIGSLRVLEGGLPPRVLGLVVEWAAQHREALLLDWQLVRDEKPPEKIEPLA